MIHDGWAFKANEHELAKENQVEYEKLKLKYRIIQAQGIGSPFPTSYNPDDFDLIYIRTAKYHRGEYDLLKKPEGITDLELLLIFDGGNLCFGGSKIREDKYQVFED